MAKKKAKAGSKKATKKVARQKSVARAAKKTAKKKLKKVARKTVKKLARKKAVKKPAKLKKPVKRAAAPRKPATKPKLPRRTKQALPPKAPSAPPVVEAEPVAAALPRAIEPAPQPLCSFAPGGVVEAEVVGTDVKAKPAVLLNVGDLAPDFSLPDEKGQLHSLSQYRGKQVVLYFYPKDDTPGCTTEACGFRNALGEFTTRNAVVLGISPDSVVSHQRFVQKYNLTFPLLADEGHAVAERYGVWVQKARGGEPAMGIARTTFLIGPDGRITHVVRNVHPEGHEHEVLRLLGT